MTLRDDVIECQCQIPALIDLYPRYFPDNAGRRFVEVGAFDGFHWSNTYPLINLGWSGLMFEPCAEFYQMCRERYAKNPQIEIEQCAIAETCGQTKLFTGGSMTTISEGLIGIWNKIEWVAQMGISTDRYTICDMHTLNCRLNDCAFPYNFDLLSIDAEGADDRVLQGLDLSVYHPAMIIIELDVESREPVIVERVNWIKAHLISAGYSMIHTDAINTIYWRAHVN